SLPGLENGTISNLSLRWVQTTVPCSVLTKCLDSNISNSLSLGSLKKHVTLNIKNITTFLKACTISHFQFFFSTNAKPHFSNYHNLHPFLTVFTLFLNAKKPLGDYSHSKMPCFKSAQRLVGFIPVRTLSFDK